MNDEKTNCCSTDNSDCNTQETNCCTTENGKETKSYKKKIGLGVFLLALTFAVASAFNMNSSSENLNCSPGQENCATSCEVGSKGTSCCSKK